MWPFGLDAAASMWLGKLLETFGSALLCYLGVRATLLEIFIGRHLRKKAMSDSSDLSKLGERLRDLQKHRDKVFGPTEIYIVAAGTLLIAIGCLLYLHGLSGQPH